MWYINVVFCWLRKMVDVKLIENCGPNPKFPGLIWNIFQMAREFFPNWHKIWSHVDDLLVILHESTIYRETNNIMFITHCLKRKKFVEPAKGLLEGIVHQFWQYNNFFVSQQKKNFLWKVHLGKTTVIQINW